MAAHRSVACGLGRAALCPPALPERGSHMVAVGLWYVGAILFLNGAMLPGWVASRSAAPLFARMRLPRTTPRGSTVPRPA